MDGRMDGWLALALRRLVNKLFRGEKICVLCIVGCMLGGCRPRQAAPAGMAERVPDAPTRSARAAFTSDNAGQVAAAPGHTGADAVAGATGDYGIAVTVGTVAMTRVTAAAFAATPGQAVPVRVADLNTRFSTGQPRVAATRRTARETLRDREARTRRNIARYGTADTSPRAQKKPVLMADPRGTAPAPAPAPAAQP